MAYNLHIAKTYNVEWQQSIFFIRWNQFREIFNTLSEDVFKDESCYVCLDDNFDYIELKKEMVIKIKEHIDKNIEKTFIFDTTKDDWHAFKEISYQQLSELFGNILTEADPTNEYIIISYF